MKEAKHDGKVPHAHTRTARLQMPCNKTKYMLYWFSYPFNTFTSTFFQPVPLRWVLWFRRHAVEFGFVFCCVLSLQPSRFGLRWPVFFWGGKGRAGIHMRLWSAYMRHVHLFCCTASGMETGSGNAQSSEFAQGCDYNLMVVASVGGRRRIRAGGSVGDKTWPGDSVLTLDPSAWANRLVLGLGREGLQWIDSVGRLVQ